LESNARSAGPPAGWYEDPEGFGVRWWNGATWTDRHAPRSPSSVDDERDRSPRSTVLDHVRELLGRERG
jgi:Protein of unknown function (DUF2510)